MDKEIIKNFTLLKTNQSLVYLDNAATTQTCVAALKAMDDYYTKSRANIHRGVYNLSIRATEQYEAARDQVASYINADREEIIFTSGTTHSLNQLAYSLSPRLSHRDNIVLTRLEHHANIVPWQQMAKHYGFTIRYAELNKDGELNANSFQKVINANTKIVSFTLVSNVLGTVAPGQEIIKLAQASKAVTIVDAAQAAAHITLDVKKLNCDFLVFSGHKMYGPTGIGVLYGKKIFLEEHLEPFLFGGEMVQSVSYENATWAELPYKFEAGTPNIAGAIGLGAAVGWIKKAGIKKMATQEEKVISYAFKKLTPLVKIVGTRKNRIGIISFTIPGIHPHDIAEVLNQNQVCIRTGYHCAEPLHHHLGLNGTARLSIGVYNTTKDIDALVVGIKKVKKLFA
ncbi:MAG: hypothetical protein A3I29_01145 [Candidatus Magasanikbacteria bacterium RIFCSPLOWO2_02_FULL_44_11]|uniref:Cysteine desulfurase n=1 Tax=Candidatus Magasanikbacteria bacterium RIFCSPLOWO2_02_FULL_44_11 TaxID=1798689 RepID=A0A1F6N9U0_9BACT|nr:MAG: hypothetical protein A3I29_01145 [Candidatus Magasanikbacteria bacterium RIFCSPLOWO2_02_FULL_44_11]